MATADDNGGAGEGAAETPARTKAELVERLTRALSRLNKTELSELVRKLDDGDLDLRKLAQPAPGSAGGPPRFGFQQRLRDRK